MKKNIFIAASGTGGHIYPGITIADELIKLDYNPIFLINDNEASLDIIRHSEYTYLILKVSGMPNLKSVAFIKFLFKMNAAIIKALYYCIKFKPVVSVGMGGYVSVPVIIASKILKIPTLIHEQNVVPGKATKLLSKFASMIAVSFEQTKQYLKSKDILVSGNPVRKNLFNICKKEALTKLGFEENIPVIFIFGGSLGSSNLNCIVADAILNISKKLNSKLQVIHITGTKGFEEVLSKSKNIDCKYVVYQYSHDIGYLYKASDIVISRAGAGTVFELDFLNKYAILVPYMHAGGHQLYNAQVLEAKGKAQIIQEPNLTTETLEKGIMEYIDKSKNNEEVNTYNKVFPQEIIINAIMELIKK